MNTQAKIDALQFLMSQKAGVLSTISNNQPHSAYIYYVVDEDLAIYFTTPTDTRKHQDLQEDGWVAFAVGIVNPPQTVQVEGIAELVTDEGTLKAVLANYVDVATTDTRHPAPITKLHWEKGMAVYKIKPTWLRWSDFSNKKKTETDGVSVVLINNK